jgi:hypothetical protein
MHPGLFVTHLPPNLSSLIIARTGMVRLFHAPAHRRVLND